MGDGEGAVAKKRVVKKKLAKKVVKKKQPVKKVEVSEEAAEAVNEVPDMGEDSSEEAASHDSYSSDDEVGQLTRTGDVPLAWYKDEDHAGYDVEGKKIVKETKDALSKLISKFDDPTEMMTVYENLTGKGHKLTAEDVQILLNLQKNQYPDPSYNPYPEGLNFVQWDQNPFDKGCPPKSRFQPSKHEMKTIAKLVRRLRRLERNPPPPKPDPQETFLLWNDDDQDEEELTKTARRRRKFHVGPPKAQLPSTLESYNPPLEYLKTADEIAAIKEEQQIDQPDFISTKFDSLRQVPWYRNTLRERYQRCLDLFMFTRKTQQKINVKPESLLPDLPKPEELRPYPQKLGFTYRGHTGPVRQLSVSHNGEWLATGCDDHFARVYEVCTGRLVAKWNLKAPVSCVAWNPNPNLNILAISADKLVVFAVPKSCAVDSVNEQSVESLLKGNKETTAVDAMQIVSTMTGDGDSDAEVDHNLDDEIAEEDAPERDIVEWSDAPLSEQKQGIIIKAVHHFKIKNFAWHHKGDYLGTICPKDKKSRQVVLLQISVRSSISPFKRFKENVQSLSFHPTQPYLLIATRRTVRMYNLVQSQLIKKFKGTVDSVSSVDVHAGGDNILVGSHDGPVMWYDVDLSDKPYKKLTSHKKAAVHTAKYHPTPSVYPLFASAGDNGQIHVFHGQVYDDYTKNPFLVPLKIIKAHKVSGNVGILNIAFHPTLPWLFSAAADGNVKCWTE
eukprot:TRINITY_DN9363_c0_g1_i2.p1 TRINITY_DN9363_c0_g1~~TRINITY_DN9363_c0_g1_i2.p1  ORF type:complete len:727 (+),score=149.80 TRINITY_DN9363_c0_g1_i2:54-2234(+)